MPADPTYRRCVVLLGASISRDWRLEQFAQRTGMTAFDVVALQEYAFDKSRLLVEVLTRPRLPDAIVIKECAAYFPGDPATYRMQVTQWIDRIAQAGVLPVLATTVPVTRKLALPVRLRRFFRRHVLGQSLPDSNRRLQALLEYNDWIRRHAGERDLPVLDLERAVRIADADRALDPAYDDGDGLHLNANGYRALDAVLLNTLRVIAGRSAGSNRNMV